MQILQTLTEKGLSPREARLLMSYALDIPLSQVFYKTIFTEDETQKIFSFLERRLQGEPFSRMVGKREFWSLTLGLNACTLDPRPDSECLIELAITCFKHKTPPEKILDLGTGSGALLLALLTEFPNAFGIGIDLQEGAALMAQENAESHHLLDRSAFMVGSWGTALKSQQTFSLIVTNPPYIPSSVIPTLDSEVVRYDPLLALDGGDDGLEAYKTFIPSLKNLLKPEGIILSEIGYDQGCSVPRIFEDHGFMTTVFKGDQGHDRVVMATLP